MVPFLAGILIIGLVYITQLASSIIQLISGINIELAGKKNQRNGKSYNWANVFSSTSRSSWKFL